MYKCICFQMQCEQTSIMSKMFPCVLQTVDADHSKSPEGLLGVLGHMLSGKSLDLLLAAAAATGKLKSFARKFIK